jgi:hypothetical protein
MKLNFETHWSIENTIRRTLNCFEKLPSIIANFVLCCRSDDNVTATGLQSLELLHSILIWPKR